MAEIVLKAVSKRFGEALAVDSIDLTIADGEFVVFLGPTGAGKTTTLRLIAGLETPDGGQVLIDGEEVTALPPAARDVAFVFQQYSLYPHYSVFDNLAFPLRAPGLALSKQEVERRVREIAELLRIESKLKNPVTQLSGGEMQRVAIGRALVRRPTIYLMDEPLSSLDAKLREDLRVELKRIQRDLGATILYVTHDQLEAMTLADRIGVLAEGRLVQLGSPREVYEAPDNTYVARRLGSPQINLVVPALLGLDDLPSGTATVGIRPEDLLLQQDLGVEAKVLAVEHLGVETVVQLEVKGERLQALLDMGDSLAKGDLIKIAVRQGAAISFDAAGQRIAGAERPVTKEAAYGT